MSLNSQLLDAIQQKLDLSQQLEAWQVGGRGSQAQVHVTPRVLLVGQCHVGLITKGLPCQETGSRGNQGERLKNVSTLLPPRVSSL